MLQVISDIDDSIFKGKKVFVRVDFNVSINNGSVGENYIRKTIPTIEYLTKRSAKVIIASHLGRPKGFQCHHSQLPLQGDYLI